MNLIERARRAQAGRDNRDAVNAEAGDQHERANLADEATAILNLDPPVNAAMLQAVHAVYGHRALYRFEYEGMRFVIGHYWHGHAHGERYSTLLAVQLEQHRGWPQWPPPHPRSVATKTRWAPAGYHAVHDLAGLADALDESTVSTGEPC